MMRYKNVVSQTLSLLYYEIVKEKTVIFIFSTILITFCLSILSIIPIYLRDDEMEVSPTLYKQSRFLAKQALFSSF